VSAACPGFVEFVERGQTVGDEVTVLAERLLAPIRDADIDALLLGCTHYPFLARTISDVMGPDVTLVSSADETAFAARERLEQLGLLRDSTEIGQHRFLSSGDIDVFRELGGRLLGPELAATERWPLRSH
jgi:glutamate racemase